MIETEIKDPFKSPEADKDHFKDLRMRLGEEDARILVSSGPPKTPDAFEGSRAPKHRAPQPGEPDYQIDKDFI